MAYLDDNEPTIQQFRCPRREQPSGVIVLHTAENMPDNLFPDSGAENVANFIRFREDFGSYHDLCDSDSIINLVRYECEAFHDGTGSNRHSYGVSAATKAALWDFMPDVWRTRTVVNMARSAARYAEWIFDTRGFVIPAKRLSRAESEERQPGFITHAERDPDRRTDPGKTFPHKLFLDTYTSLIQPLTEPVTSPLKGHGMPAIIKQLSNNINYIVVLPNGDVIDRDDKGRLLIKGDHSVGAFRKVLLPKTGKPTQHQVDIVQQAIETIRKRNR